MIPTQASDITVDWLNERLAPSGVGEIVAVSAEEIGVGVGILGEVTRLTLTYGPDESGPATMIAKCQSVHPENVMLCQMMGFYEREVNFYREVGGELPVRVPRAHVAEVAEGGAPFVLLLEELTGVRMIDQIDGASRDDAMLVADAVALLHAQFWDNEAVAALDWLPPMNNDMYKGAQALGEANWDAFVAKWADKVPASTLGWVESLTPKYPAMLDWWAVASPTTLAHTDCRAENYLFGGSAGDGAVAMVDFQLLTRHVGTYDIANFLGMSVTIENRRAWEDDIVRRYHESLVAHGVEGYSFEQCWRDYRFCLLHQAWAQLAVATLDPGNDRGRELLNAFVTRSFTAAADNDSGELLDLLE